jgi:hypothetical protein
LRLSLHNYGIIPANPLEAEELFAFQIKYNETNCIATAVWHSHNIPPDQVQYYEVLGNINDKNLSRNAITTDTSNDSLIMASVFYLPRCVTNEIIITVREVDICGRPGDLSMGCQLDPEQCPCDTVTTNDAGTGGTTSTCDVRNGGNGNGKSNEQLLIYLISFIRFNPILLTKQIRLLWFS